MWLANLPFGYMYIVRLRTPSRAASLILAEWVPVTIALTLVYSAPLWLIAVMLAVNFAVYESGYFINDIADSAAEPNGDHLEGRRINTAVFFGSRIAMFLIAVAILIFAKGPRFALTYATLSILVLAGFIWHTSRRPKRLRFLRIFTFTLLYLYKFAPIVIPLVPLSDATWILTSLFLCWGLWRVIFYILGKFGGSNTSRGQDFDPIRLLHPMSLLICGPLLLANGFHSPFAKASCLIWLSYTMLAALRSAFQLTNWRLIQADYQKTA